MKSYTREELVSLLDFALAYIEQPSLYSADEVSTMLSDMAEAVDAEFNTVQE